MKKSKVAILLKESLHIHYMKIVFFETNQIYFLGYGHFPICDVAGDNLGNPRFFLGKGIPMSKTFFFLNTILRYILNAMIREASVIHFI